MTRERQHALQASSTRVQLQVLVNCCGFVRVRQHSDIHGRRGLESCTSKRTLGKCLSELHVLGGYIKYSFSNVRASSISDSTSSEALGS